MRPARSIRRWEMISASAGTSLSVLRSREVVFIRWAQSVREGARFYAGGEGGGREMRAEEEGGCTRRAGAARGLASYWAMSLSFFRGVIRTRTEAGLAATSMVSPGLKGLGTPFLARCAGFFTVLIFSRPGRANSPTARFFR